jgi:hypothetical protein
MLGRLVAKVLISSVLLLIVAVSTTSPVVAHRNSRTHNESSQDAPEVSFVLNRLPENHRLYSLVISDTDEHVISGTFSVEQLQILRAIMIEAEKFALTSESVGSKEPITTRFLDKQEPAFVCDVEKLGMESAFFLTLTTENGRNTLNAGKMIRSTRRQQGFFFNLLSQLDALLPKPPVQPGKRVSR